MSSTAEHLAPVNVRLRGQQTDGHLAVIELIGASDTGGPPLHVHPGHAEGFYGLKGELRVQVGARVVTGAAGACSFARRARRTRLRTSAGDARMLVLCTPAGFEAYFDQLAAGRPAVPPAGQAWSVGPQIARPLAA
jgi:quercetin dioxygenase-like cupin family protein